MIELTDRYANLYAASSKIVLILYIFQYSQTMCVVYKDRNNFYKMYNNVTFRPFLRISFLISIYSAISNLVARQNDGLL